MKPDDRVIPEAVHIAADEVYFDTLESGTRWTDSRDVRVGAEMLSRHNAYAKVRQDARQPLIELLAAARTRLDRCAEHHGLATAASQDIRLLIAAIDDATAVTQ